MSRVALPTARFPTHPAGASGAVPTVSLAGWCLAACILACVFEGAGRKWVVPNADRLTQAAFYFAKDVPLGIAFIIGLNTSARAPIARSLRQILMAGTGLVALGTLTSLDGITPIGGVLSGRALFYLPWAALVIAPTLRGRRDIDLILHVIGACVVFNAILGVSQFFLPESHILNRRTSDEIAAVGSLGRVRAFGTFAYLGGMGDLCSTGCWLGAVLISRSPRSPIGYLYAAAALAIGLAIMSRGALLIGFSIFILSLLSTQSGRAGLVVLVGVLMIGLFTTLDGDDEGGSDKEVGLHDAVVRRHERASDSFGGRIGRGFESLFRAMAEVPTGRGLGVGQTGQRASDANTAGVSQYEYEGEPSRIVAEIGIIGFFGAMILRFGVPLTLWQHLPDRLQPHSRPCQSLWWPTIWMCIMSYNMLVVFNHVAATLLTIIVTLSLNAHEREAAYRRTIARGPTAGGGGGTWRVR